MIRSDKQITLHLLNQENRKTKKISKDQETIPMKIYLKKHSANISKRITPIRNNYNRYHLYWYRALSSLWIYQNHLLHVQYFLYRFCPSQNL